MSNNKQTIPITLNLSIFSVLFVTLFRSRPLEVILWKTVLKICSTFTGEHFNKVALHRLLLKPGPGPWTQTQNKLDPENCDSWKTWETAGCKKKIGRPHSVIYHNTKILKEETCKRAIWKKIVIEAY